MDMWDWKAGNWQGITDSEGRAKEHAESHLRPGLTARVVKVNSQYGHSHTLGSGWTAKLTEQGGVDWQFSREMWAPRPANLPGDNGQPALCIEDESSPILGLSGKVE